MQILTQNLLNQISDFQIENRIPKFGKKLSNYEVVGHLGRGATANVYKVRSREAP
jgi:hypothetical protein